MKCYHMTKVDNLCSISKLGLVPGNGENSKLINDEKVKVFFSEGFTGAIALYVDFNIVYNQVKQKEIILNDYQLEQKVLTSDCLEDYLGDGIYLSFDMGEIANERNFENGCTDQVISPDIINVVVLKDEEGNIISSSRFDIIHYMMSVTPLNDIKYYGITYPNSPTFQEATIRIQGKVGKYYKQNQNLIEHYKDPHYQLDEVPLISFVDDYKNNKKCL